MKTTDTIIDFIKDSIEQDLPIPPGKWIDAAFSLNALIGTENVAMAILYQKAHKIMRERLVEGKSGIVAETEMKASDEYRDWLIQKGKVEQIVEFIRLAKIRSQGSKIEADL